MSKSADAPTTSAASPAQARLGAGASPQNARPRGRRAGRLGTVAVLIVALVFATLARHFAMRFQEAHSPPGQRTVSRASLAGMDSYALALLLGGLRGPLVMLLWANSESQKADRDLEGLDTQIEWIRRLQPEFDTVHVFQMWNKAYNISVQMVGLSNKYSVILDALDYGKSIDAERPDNLNILKEIARIYSDKLGNSMPERYYYRDRIRRETRYRPTSSAAQRGEPGFQRLAHDPLLDTQGNILAEYLKPRFTLSQTRPAGPESGYDGSELEFIERYQPFPYGVSPVALGYNYHKRSQVLMSTMNQKPIQISESVQDSQPALTLKMWAEEEWERGRRLECKALDKPLPTERIDQEMPTADVPVDAKIIDPSVVPELLYSYDMAIRVAGDSIVEFERHLRNPQYATKRAMYAPHIDHLTGMGALVSGDRDYVKAMQSSGDERAKLLSSAALHYRNAIRVFGLTAIRYYTGDAVASVVLPPGVTRADIGTGPVGSRTAVTFEDVLRILSAIDVEVDRLGGPLYDDNNEDRHEYHTYVDRAVERLRQIKQATRQ